MCGLRAASDYLIALVFGFVLLVAATLYGQERDLTAEFKAAKSSLKPQPETYAGLAILLASELTDVREEATGLVLESLERPQGRNILITLADELGNCRGDNACRSLVQLMGLPLFKEDFAFRRAVEQA